MIEKLLASQSRRNLPVFAAIGVLSAVAIAWYGLQQGLSYKELIVAFGALLCAVIIFGGERGIHYGLVLWVLTLAFGYRTIEYTPDLRIHPAEILLWLLLVCIFWQRQLVARSRITLPVWLWLSIPFWLLAWWPLITGDARWDQMLSEFRDFLLLIPLMIVASAVLQHQEYWPRLLTAFFIASSWIAGMGIIEYWFPSTAGLFPAFMASPKAGATAEGFARATFSFWGGATATFVCVLALPAAIVLARWWSRWWQRVVIVAASAAQILAIYIGGYRSIWLVLLIQILTVCFLRLRKEGAVVALVCLIVVVGSYQFIPKTTERASSTIAVLQGRSIDSSALERQDRALGALDSVVENPLGLGWNSAGWVHSDFLQVAVNLGLLGGLIFLGGYLYTLLKLGRRVVLHLVTGEQGELGFSLLVMFIGAGGLLAMEGVYVLPQMALPVWFVWVLVEVWLRQPSGIRDIEKVSRYRLLPVGGVSTSA